MSEESYYRQLPNEMQNKRDQLVEYLQEAKLDPVMPGGGYFIVANISKLGKIRVFIYLNWRPGLSFGYRPCALALIKQ